MAARDEGLSLPVQDFIGDDSNQCPAHERATLARTDQLFAWNCIEKFEKITIEIGIAFLVWWAGRQCRAADLPSECFQCAQVILKTGQGPKQVQPSLIANQRGWMALDKARMQPCGRLPVFRSANKGGRK